MMLEAPGAPDSARERRSSSPLAIVHVFIFTIDRHTMIIVSYLS